MKIVLLNTTIVTTDGDYSIKTISLEKARELIKGVEILSTIGHQFTILSAIGHQSTADILSELLEIPISINRIMYTQEVGDIALCFKLNGRPEEGKILTADEIKEIGYEFKTMTRIS